MKRELEIIRPSDAPSISIMETDGPEPRFLHSVLCQVGLPRSATSEAVFTRTSGRVSVTLQAGVFFNGVRNIPQPLPFGCKPRLTLIYACSEALRTRQRSIEIGHSVRGFLRQLEIDCGGKEMAAFRKQMLALASCHMILGPRDLAARWSDEEAPDLARARIGGEHLVVADVAPVRARHVLGRGVRLDPQHAAPADVRPSGMRRGTRMSTTSPCRRAAASGMARATAEGLAFRPARPGTF